MSLDEHASALAASLAKAGLAPGPASALLPTAAPFAPTTSLRVSFEKGAGAAAGKAVDLGTFFRAGECGRAPRVSFAAEEGADADADADVSYLLVLTDPDAPTPDDPRFAFWRHWVVGGLRPGDNVVAAAAEPAVLTAYLGPGPKDDSKPHRYLFLLYREPAGLALSKGDVGGEEFVQRRSFCPAEFAAKHGLKLVAVNWMTCAGDGWKE